MSNWRDWEPGRTGVSVANLADGESLTVQVIDEPFRQDTEQSEEALHVPVKVLESPEGFPDMSGDNVDSETEYNIINSSTAFFNALMNAFPEGQQVQGQHLEIEAHQPDPDDQFSRAYEIEAV